MTHCRHHFLLISLPAQGHINPAINLAKNLIRAGSRVTFATTVSGLHNLKSQPSVDGLSYASFTDGHDEDLSATVIPGYVQNLKRVGSKTLATLILTFSDAGNPVTFLVYALFLPWAAAVARELNIPSALLVVQPATAFAVYDRFCDSRDGIAVVNKTIDTTISLKLPGIPLLTWGDFPTFILPTNPFFSDMIWVCREQIQVLEEDPNHRILLNTFDALEPDSIKSISNSNAITIGPLIPGTFSGENGRSVKNFSFDMFLDSDRDSYLRWLDSKPEKSVVYLSFGSVAKLKKRQKEEILHGLIETGRPFLVVLREDGEEEDEGIKRLKEKMGDLGLIVGWCSQVEVLRQSAIGCFVTHCGWNSTLESMAAGVAMVVCPQMADQTLNAKMVEDVWGNGVRAVADEERVVGRGEIRRCLEVVMGGGERGEEIRKNVEKWKKEAMEAVKDGGSSQVNLHKFLESIA